MLKIDRLRRAPGRGSKGSGPLLVHVAAASILAFALQVHVSVAAVPDEGAVAMRDIDDQTATASKPGRVGVTGVPGADTRAVSAVLRPLRGGPGDTFLVQAFASGAGDRESHGYGEPLGTAAFFPFILGHEVTFVFPVPLGRFRPTDLPFVLAVALVEANPDVPVGNAAVRVERAAFEH